MFPIASNYCPTCQSYVTNMTNHRHDEQSRAAGAESYGYARGVMERGVLTGAYIPLERRPVTALPQQPLPYNPYSSQYNPLDTAASTQAHSQGAAAYPTTQQAARMLPQQAPTFPATQAPMPTTQSHFRPRYTQHHPRHQIQTQQPPIPTTPLPRSIAEMIQMLEAQTLSQQTTQTTTVPQATPVALPQRAPQTQAADTELPPPYTPYATQPMGPPPPYTPASMYQPPLRPQYQDPPPQGATQASATSWAYSPRIPAQPQQILYYPPHIPPVLDDSQTEISDRFEYLQSASRLDLPTPIPYRDLYEFISTNHRKIWNKYGDYPVRDNFLEFSSKLIDLHQMLQTITKGCDISGSHPTEEELGRGYQYLQILLEPMTPTPRPTDHTERLYGVAWELMKKMTFMFDHVSSDPQQASLPSHSKIMSQWNTIMQLNLEPQDFTVDEPITFGSLFDFKGLYPLKMCFDALRMQEGGGATAHTLSQCCIPLIKLYQHLCLFQCLFIQLQNEKYG